MRFKQLDLNLLVALDALLSLRSVSAAARHLFITQPSMSTALAQLRRHFQDELLVQVGRKMVPTAFGEQLAEQVRALMMQIETTVSHSPEFDPATAKRHFGISASDHAASIVLSEVAVRIASLAPHVTLDIIPMLDDPTSAMEMGELDFIYVPEFVCSPDHPYDVLYEEDHVVLGWKQNLALQKQLTLDQLLQMRHMVVRTGRNRVPSLAEMEMNRLSRAWKIELVTSTFASVPRLLIGTPRVAVIQKRLAERAVKEMPLVMQPFPVPFPKVRESLQFHSARAGDPGIQWMRKMILEVANEKR